MLPIVAAGQKTLGWSDSPWHRRLFSMSNQGKILDLPGRWWCRDDSDELLPCAMTSGGNVGNFIIQSFPPFSPESDLFWQGGGGSRWFQVTFINIKSGLSHLVFRYLHAHIFYFQFFSSSDSTERRTRNQKHLQGTSRRDTGGLWRYTSTQGDTLQCQKCWYKSSPMSVYRRQTELWQVDTAVKANPRS